MQTVDIRELQERIERESSFVDALTMGMNHVIVGQKHLVESLLIGLLAGEIDGVSSIGRVLAEKYRRVAADERDVATSSNGEVKETEIKADISEAEVTDNEYLDLDNIF